MNFDDSHSTRHGQIAHFPPAIYQEPTDNERLAAGERRPHLVRWLDSLPAVQECLAASFKGRPINDAHRSAWKLGDFREKMEGQSRQALIKPNQGKSRQIKVRENWQNYRETRAPRPMQVKEARAKKKQPIQGALSPLKPI